MYNDNENNNSSNYEGLLARQAAPFTSHICTVREVRAAGFFYRIGQ